jgi:hypothetical protein
MSDNKDDDCCLYHAIINAIERYKEAHSPQNVDDIIDATADGTSK